MKQISLKRLYLVSFMEGYGYGYFAWTIQKKRPDSSGTWEWKQSWFDCFLGLSALVVSWNEPSGPMILQIDTYAYSVSN